MGELEKTLCEKDNCLTSLKNEHDRLLEKYNRLNRDHAVEFNDAKNKESNLKSEVEQIRKERDSVKLEFGKMSEDLSRHAAVISSFKAAELGIRNEVANKNQEISRWKEKVIELEKQAEINRNDLEKEEDNYTKCYAQVQQFQNDNLLLEKTVADYAERLSHQSTETAQEKERNNALRYEVERLNDQSDQQKNVINDVNEQIKNLKDTVVKSGQKEHSLSLKFNSCVDQMELMENQIAESQQIFLFERHAKEDAEKAVQDARNELNTATKEKEDLAHDLTVSQSKCVKLDSKRRELALNLKYAI